MGHILRRTGAAQNTQSKDSGSVNSSFCYNAVMGYHTLKSCITNLRRAEQLIEFHEEVDPYLELAAAQCHRYNESNTSFTPVYQAYFT